MDLQELVDLQEQVEARDLQEQVDLQELLVPEEHQELVDLQEQLEMMDQIAVDGDLDLEQGQLMQLNLILTV